MPVEKAKNHYLGKAGYVRMNCAQSVMYSFMERFGLSENEVEVFGKYGSGRAPAGQCGAYYAAKTLLEKEGHGVEGLDQYFKEHAGSVRCHDIRSARKLSCVGCVEKSAQYLMKTK